jgi:hypothetical protein
MTYLIGPIVILAMAAQAAQTQSGQNTAPARPTPMIGMQAAPAAEGPLEIYQIDRDPTGSAFSLNKPVLEGNVYVFKNWPERQNVRLDASKVKKITQRTKDLNQEVVYQIDLVPKGRMIAKEEPTVKGATYVFHTWRNNTIMSVRKTDVKQIVKVTGLAAFKIQQEERGASLNAHLPMEGGTATVLPGGPEPPQETQSAPQPAPGNWGYPAGISEANPPPSAVVSSPGDVPKAAPPPPTPQPR